MWSLVFLLCVYLLCGILCMRFSYSRVLAKLTCKLSYSILFHTLVDVHVYMCLVDGTLCSYIL